MHLLDNKVF